MSTIRTTLAVVASAVLVLIAAGPAGAQASARGVQVAAGNAGSARAAAAASVEQYWTPERMAEAVAAGPSRPDATSGGPAPRSGQPGRVPGAAPTVPQARADIHTMNGRVFYRDDRGDNHSCSGSTVYSDGRRLVFTAGHCVHGGGGGRGWYDVSSWIFVPNYHSGAPYQIWHAAQLWSKNGWINDGNRAWDVAAVVMQDRDGVRIVDALGGQGIEWNYGYGRHIYMFGYPAGPPFDGTKLYYCVGDTRDEGGFPTLGCNMTGGASGGPWLDQYGKEWWAYLDGVNSWMFWDPDPQHVYKWQSPYFSWDTAGNLWDQLKNA